MLPNAHYTDVERIGEYINRNSCARRFKLDLDGRKLAKELPLFTRHINPIDPVLQASRSLQEGQWERFLHDACHVDLLTKLHQVDDLPFDWERFGQLLPHTTAAEGLYAREVPTTIDSPSVSPSMRTF